ncbi:MAG: inner membrane-spanning protein YciB [Sphingomicrobium sp.]
MSAPQTPGKPATPETPARKGPGWSLLIDYGPLLVFFIAYKVAGGGLDGALTATICFMVAIVASVIAGLVILKRVPPMVWLSAILVLGFGGLTLWLKDPRFIQIKPTVIYIGLAAVLLIGLMRGKSLLKWLFGPIFPGLDEIGWRKLSRNWALFFLALAGANEVIRHAVDFDTWLSLKVWCVSLASFVFAAANMPMLLRHGLDAGHGDDSIARTPIE